MVGPTDVAQPWMPRAARDSDACLWHVSVVGGARRRGCAAAGVPVCVKGPCPLTLRSAGARRSRRGRVQAVRAAARARAHAQGARPASVPARRLGPAAGARRRLVHGPEGRVLRDRRPQRLRQEHAAEVPGRDLPRRRGPDPHARAPVDVHRARRRLQPGPGGARQRPDQRDHARPHAEGGAAPLRQHHRVRRARGVRRPQAQELLVGHAGPARVQRDDPGRRRHPADRRGARGRRRGVPAEVLRRVPADEGRGQDDPVRHPRHGRGLAVLRPRDADRPRPRGADRRAGRGRHALPGAQLRP